MIGIVAGYVLLKIGQQRCVFHYYAFIYYGTAAKGRNSGLWNDKLNMDNSN